MYFEFNGVACIEPERVISDFESLGLDTSWRGMANSFLHRRGIEPSIGYLLVPAAACITDGSSLTDIPVDSATLTIKSGVWENQSGVSQSSVTLFSKTVLVHRVLAVYPYPSKDKGVYLIEVRDKRELWKTEYQPYSDDAKYNFVTGGHSNGTNTYDSDTTNGGPAYTWIQLLEDFPGNLTSETLTASGPTGGELSEPENVDLRGMSTYTALKMLLRQCAHTVIPGSATGGGDFSWDIDGIINSGGAELTTAFTNYNDRTHDDYAVLVDEKHPMQGPFNKLVPANADLYFIDKDKLGDKSNSRFKVDKATGAHSDLADTNYVLTTTLNKVYLEVTSDSDPNGNETFIGNYADDVLDLLNDYWDTHKDVRTTTFGRGIAIYPTSYIYSVEWNNQQTIVTSVTEDELNLHNEIDPYDDRHVTILLGETTSSVSSGTSTFNIDNIDVVFGNDPRTDKNSATETLSVTNTFSQDYGNNDLVLAIDRESNGEWEVFKPGGSSEVNLLHFELTEDMALADDDASAKLLEDDGTDVSPQEDIEVVDIHNKWWGLADYTGADNSSQNGYRGWALQFTDDYNGTGNPGAHIINMDGPAPAIIVALRAVVNDTGLQECDLANSGTSDYFGSSNCHRIPELDVFTGDDGIEVSNLHGLATGGDADEEWLAAWDHTNSEYIFLARMGRPDLQPRIVKGQATAAYDVNDGTITLDNLVAVQGRLPESTSGDVLSTITIDNVPVLEGADNDVIYALYDESAGTNESDSWTTALMGANLERFKDFDGTEDYQVFVHAEGDYQWMDAVICNPP